MVDLTQNKKWTPAPSDSFVPPSLPLAHHKGILWGKTAIIIAWLAMLLFALHASTHMVGAGDTWVALACGRHFINHGVDTNEPFSANSHRVGPTVEEIKTWPAWAQWITDKVGLDTVKYWHPTGWVNQNWLTHTIFYWLAYKSPIADGPDWVFNSLVYWKFTIYILTVICVYCTSRILGVSPPLAAAFACAAMFVSRSFLDIRPAGFSNLLVAAFILTVALATYRNHLYIWLIVPMTIFWANLHGGYIYVFIALTPLVMLRLFTMLSKRATVSLFSILTWLALYLMMFKDIAHEPFTAVAMSSDKLLVFIVLLIVGSVVLSPMKSVQAPLFYAYHILAFIIVFIALVTRFYPSELPIATQQMDDYVQNSRISFFTAALAAVAMGLIVTLLKERLLATTPAALAHTAAAGVAAFIASIIFNPFHLTNLTHTFQISISPNAEGWRNVHEWWPAFRWENPVGTAFPYLVMLVAGSGLLVLYIISRFLVPKLMKGPKQELDNQQKRFDILSRILGFATAVLVCWVLMISFSLCDVSLGSFLLSGLFVGILWISVFINVHFIYLIVPLGMFALFTADAKSGYLGRYIFPFITVPCYVLMYAVVSQISKKPKYSALNVLYVLAAGVAGVIITAAAVNPFKFTQPVWHLEQFAHLQRIWSPVYEANLDLTYSTIFPVLYGINVFCVAIWLLSPYIKTLFETAGLGEQAGTAGNGQYQLLKVDLALIAIAAMSMYMAFRSRRFITIAAYVTCPVIAMIIQQILQTAGASLNFYKKGRLVIPAVPQTIQRLIVATALVVVVGLGGSWGWKFKSIYLDPWPTETKLGSMFMRMTASHAKPFYACEFIKTNKLRGNMFNYWTEGGFIAWGQEPDPDGKTPLQLFMDGRAQAAYNFDAYIRWSEVMFGGDIVQRLRLRKREFTGEDYSQVGAWINEQLKQSKAWVVLMPSNQFDTPFVRGLEYNADWRLVFMDDKQKLYVDITTARGKEIFEGTETGSTPYPGDCYRNIMIANNALVFSKQGEVLSKALDCAIKSYEEEPSRIAVQLIQIFYDRYPALRPQIDEFWKKVVDDFLANKKNYFRQAGYHHRVVAALVGIEHLRPVLAKENNNEKLQRYEKERVELTDIMNELRDKTW
jgi:hypothetical protein